MSFFGRARRLVDFLIVVVVVVLVVVLFGLCVRSAELVDRLVVCFLLGRMGSRVAVAVDCRGEFMGR
jgi:hypothetical protein